MTFGRPSTYRLLEMEIGDVKEFETPTTADVIRIAKLVTAEELRVEGFDWITTDHVFASFVHDALSIQVFRELPRTCSIRIGEKDA